MALERAPRRAAPRPDDAPQLVDRSVRCMRIGAPKRFADCHLILRYLEQQAYGRASYGRRAISALSERYLLAKADAEQL